MNYTQLQQAIQDYTENYEQTFINNIPLFIQEAEDRVYNSVQIPALRKNVTGTMTSGNQYVSLPYDWLSNYSIAAIDASGNYTYLLNKDVNFIREAYPNNSTANRAFPKYYALFGSTYGSTENMSLIVGPTPDQNYNMEMHYFYYPPTIVQGQISPAITGSLPYGGLGTIVGGTGYNSGVYENVALSGGSGTGANATITVAGGSVTSVTLNNGGSYYIPGDVLTTANTNIGNAGSGFTVTVNSISNANGRSWLGDNYDPVLFYGAMREAMLFMKQEQDLITYYENKYNEALQQLKRLGDGLERGDAYRDGQTKIKVTT